MVKYLINLSFDICPQSDRSEKMSWSSSNYVSVAGSIAFNMGSLDATGRFEKFQSVIPNLLLQFWIGFVHGVGWTGPIPFDTFSFDDQDKYLG